MEPDRNQTPIELKVRVPLNYDNFSHMGKEETLKVQAGCIDTAARQNSTTNSHIMSITPDLAGFLTTGDDMTHIC